MHSVTSPSLVTTSSPSRHGRMALAVASLLALAILAGCASRSTRAPVTDMSGGQTGTAPATGTCVVKPGDTLYQIAQRHGMEVNTLISLNNISDPGQLRVGQTLRLSGSAAPVAPTSPSTATPLPVTPVEPSEPPTPTPAADAKLISWGWPAS